MISHGLLLAAEGRAASIVRPPCGLAQRSAESAPVGLAGSQPAFLQLAPI
jgi:hypothetical protein